jgi:hypothetical protein
MIKLRHLYLSLNETEHINIDLETREHQLKEGKMIHCEIFHLIVEFVISYFSLRYWRTFYGLKMHTINTMISILKGNLFLFESSMQEKPPLQLQPIKYAERS